MVHTIEHTRIITKSSKMSERGKKRTKVRRWIVRKSFGDLIRAHIGLPRMATCQSERARALTLGINEGSHRSISLGGPV